MAIKDKETYKKIMRARTRLLIKEPFFGTLALLLGAEERADAEWWKAAGGTDTPTMAVDGYTMYYHPAFVQGLSEEELIGVTAHEIMHCVLKHMSRRGFRHPVIWNWAGDYVINDMLLEANFVLPKKRLHDKKYAGMSTDEVYERIKQDQMQKGQNADGKDKDKGGCGSVLDAGKPGDKDKDAKQSNADRDWESNVRMAVAAVRASKAGTVPSYLDRIAGELKAPRVSWRQLLRQFIDGNMHKDYSYARCNRRNSSLHPLVLPGLVPDALHKLVCFMDVSGSVSQDLMNAMAAEVGGALDDGVADQLILAYIDTEIKKVDEYLPGDLIKANCQAGGGTDFRPAFEWVREYHPDTSCIIYLTDMMPCTWELPPCDLPVMWAAWCPDSYLKGLKPPYGTIIHVDSSE